MSDAIPTVKEYTAVRFLWTLPGMARPPHDPEDTEEVAKRLRALQRALGYRSARAFAKAMGFAPQQYGNWVNPGNPRPIPPRPAVDLCLKTGVDMDYIYRGIVGSVPRDLAIKLEDELKRGDPVSRRGRYPRSSKRLDGA